MRLCFVSRAATGIVLEHAVDAARSGHDVTLIHGGSDAGTTSAAPDLPGEKVSVCVPPPLSDGRTGHYYHPDHEYSDRVYDLVVGLSEREPFDAVEFDRRHAEGFTCIRARRLLGEFAGTRFSVLGEDPGDGEGKRVTADSAHGAWLREYAARHAEAEPARQDGGGERVSVVVPLFNQGRWLREAVDSALASDYADLEVVVVNDGSTEPETIAAFHELTGDRIVKVEKVRGGLSNARNAGIAAASGSLVLPLDADDVIDPHYVGEAVRALRANPGLAYVGCYVRTFGAEDGFYIPLGFVRETLPVCNPAGKCASLFRSTALEAVGGYDETLPFYEDWDLLCRLAATRWDGDVLPRIRLRYRRHDESMVHNMDPDAKEVVLQRLAAHASTLPAPQARIAIQVLSHWQQQSHGAELRWQEEAQRLDSRLADLAAERDDLRKETDRLRSESEELRAQRAAALHEAEASQSLVAAMRGSLSWRLTAPLRAISRALRGERRPEP